MVYSAPPRIKSKAMIHQGTKPYTVDHAPIPSPRDTAPSGVWWIYGITTGGRQGIHWVQSGLNSGYLFLFLGIRRRRKQRDVDLIDFRVQMPATPWRLQVKDTIVGESSSHPPGVHICRQDIGATELSRHEAVAIQTLGVSGRHLQQVIHSPHRHLIWGKVAHIQKCLELAFTEPEL